MVSIASWNIRGLNSLIKQTEVKNLLQENKITVLGLLETKVKAVNCDRVMRNISDWRWISNHNSSYNGRVMVLWDSRKIELKEVQQGEQYIHCFLTVSDTGQRFYCTFLYACNTDRERGCLWQALYSIAGQMNSPWVVLGDFNTCPRYDERWMGGVTVQMDTTELETVITECDLADLRYSGVFLTWCNKREGDERMYAKLDRILVNGQWIQEYAWTAATFLESGISDHSPGILEFSKPPSQPSSFKFCNIWATDPQFQTIVDEEWSKEYIGVPMFQVVQKMKGVKQKLKGLHRSKYCRLSDKLKGARSKLTDMQAKLQTEPRNVVWQGLEKQYYEEFMTLAKAEIYLFRQRSKEEWLEDMDGNNAYFHARVQEKLAFNRIKRLSTPEGVSVTQEEEIAQQFITFYEQLYGETSTDLQSVKHEIIQQGPLVSEQQASQLCVEVTDDEIKQALFSISSNKSPGSDGFGAGFFKAAWNTVGGIFAEQLKSFLGLGSC